MKFRTEDTVSAGVSMLKGLATVGMVEHSASFGACKTRGSVVSFVGSWASNDSPNSSNDH